MWIVTSQRHNVVVKFTFPLYSTLFFLLFFFQIDNGLSIKPKRLNKMFNSIGSIVLSEIDVYLLNNFVEFYKNQ